MELIADTPQRQQMLELLEEIEAITSEIHCRALSGRRAQERLAEEAARLVHEGERMFARRATSELDQGKVCAYLTSRRDRLRRILHEIETLP